MRVYRLMIPMIDQLREAERELDNRRKVYAHRVAGGLMEQGKADRKLALQSAIVQTLRGVYENEAV